MWLWAKRPLWRPQPHEVNQAWLFGPLFHQEVLHIIRCGGNLFLPSNSYLGQWKSYSWCMWPRVHIMNVSICSTNVLQVEGVYMDLIKFRVHHEANLWQAQIFLMGTSKCGWIENSRWFLMTLRYHLLRLKAQEGHLALTHKLDVFHLIMGLCSSWWCLLFPRYRWGEWDSCPFHQRDPNTYQLQVMF
jgi:hypothetical protein